MIEPEPEPEGNEYEDNDEPKGAGTGSPCDKVATFAAASAFVSMLVYVVYLLVGMR